MQKEKHRGMWHFKSYNMRHSTFKISKVQIFSIRLPRGIENSDSPDSFCLPFATSIATAQGRRSAEGSTLAMILRKYVRIRQIKSGRWVIFSVNGGRTKGA